MKYFIASILNANKEIERIEIKASSEHEAQKMLKTYSFDVLELRLRPWYYGVKAELLEPTIKPKHLVELLQQIYLILRSGLSLHEGIESLVEEMHHKKLKVLVQSMSKHLASGVKLSDFMQNYPKIFSRDLIYFIRIGEQTGKLEEGLLRAKAFLERSSNLKREIKAALIYPAIIFTVAFVAVWVWFAFVLPQLVELFEQMDIDLPLLTRIIIVLGDTILLLVPWIVGIGLVLALYMWYAYKKEASFRLWFWRGISSAPLLSGWIKSYNFAYICDVLHLSSQSGITLYQSLDTIKENISNLYYKESIKEILEALSKGVPLSQAFEEQKSYSHFMVRMLKVGEKSGDLEQQLKLVALYYYEQLDFYSKHLTKLIEPLMILFVGGFFALIMVGLMGPIFDMVATIQ